MLRRQWKKVKGNYLFNELALAKVFRARCLAAFNQAGLAIPTGVPKEWVVDCQQISHGKAALKYLSCYLYRGVISENHIVSNENGQVTFKLKFPRNYENRIFDIFQQRIFLHLITKGYINVVFFGFSELLFLLQKNTPLNYNN